MSYISFTSASQHDNVIIRGPERHWMGNLVSNIFVAFVNQYPSFTKEHWIKDILPKSHYLQKMSNYEFERHLGTFLRTSFNEKFEFKDYTESIWIVGLNTALAVGNDVIKLITRIHAQCEVHCYLEEENFKWFANIIRKGLNNNILRKNMGWYSLIELLSKKNVGPLVCYYSVCDSFPNYHFAGILEDDTKSDEELEQIIDNWDELSYQERWNQCFKVLKEDKNQKLELKPDDWNDVYFGNGTTGFDLYELAMEKKEILTKQS